MIKRKKNYKDILLSKKKKKKKKNRDKWKSEMNKNNQRIGEKQQKKISLKKMLPENKWKKTNNNRQTKIEKIEKGNETQ